MKKLFFYSFLFPIFFILFLSVFIVSFSTNTNIQFTYFDKNIEMHSSNHYVWPTHGYTTITSHFGPRNSPVQGASSYHGGIDIAAPQGTAISAIDDGTVTYIGWYGAGGYTIILSHSNQIKSYYSHISPRFLCTTGDLVKKGDLIAYVGPKYINGPSNNPYKDSSGKSTNGATTGPHLHFAITKEGKKIDPSVMF